MITLILLVMYWIGVGIALMVAMLLLSSPDVVASYNTLYPSQRVWAKTVILLMIFCWPVALTLIIAKGLIFGKAKA